MHRTQRFVWLISLCSLLAWSQSAPPARTPARMVVTLGHFYGRQPPAPTPDDLTVTQDFEPLPITNLVPLRGDRAGLELFLLVDNCSNCEPGAKFEELRKFIVSQPSTTTIGVSYIQDGRLKIAESPTQDRNRVVAALSAPTGSTPSNPFGPLAELIKGWNPDSSRHAVVMISNGIDPGVTEVLRDPLAESAIEAAQRGEVSIYTIYHPSADYGTADYSKMYTGQVQLAHVAAETGGESYFLSFGPLPSLAPFLTDLAEHLSNQYLLEFLANPGEAGALQEVTIRSKNKDVELTMPEKVWVAGRAVRKSKSPGR